MNARDSSFGLRGFGPLLIFGCWLGLLTGFVEAGVLLTPKLWAPRVIHLGRDLAWMAPLSEAAWLVAAAGASAGAARLVAREWAHRAAVGGLLLLAAAGVWMSFSSLHATAVLLLSLGTAAQLSRIVLGRQVGTERLARTMLPWLAAAVLAIAAAARLGPPAFAPRPSALEASARHPNVILVTLDTVSASHLSLYGYPRPTSPFLEELAKDSTVFERAVATTSWTLPSHASMFTGRDPHELSAGWETPLDAKWPTLAEILGKAGYRTGGFVANTIYCSYEHGLDRGFQHFEDFGLTPGQFLVSSAFGRKLSTRSSIRTATGLFDVPGRKTAAAVNGHFLSWVGRDSSRPFFAWLNYFDAHEPYLPPEPFRSHFDRGHTRHLRYMEHRVGSAEFGTKWKMSADQVQAEVDAYDAAIAFIDAQLRELVTQVRGRGLLENTILIITSDHGEEFGEHGFFSHGNSLYMPVIGVPLLIRYQPSVPAGRRVSNVVSLRHLAATVTDLARTNGETLPGTPLRGVWTGYAQLPPDAFSELTRTASAPSWYPAVRGDMYSLVTEQSHYIRNGDGREELFDIGRGGPEVVRVSGLKGSEPTFEFFRRLLADRRLPRAGTRTHATLPWARAHDLRGTW